MTFLPYLIDKKLTDFTDITDSKKRTRKIEKSRFLCFNPHFLPDGFYRSFHSFSVSFF